MKIGAYQFAVASNITRNMEAIRRAIFQAAEEKVGLLVFPECALTGYPIKNERSSHIDFQTLDDCISELQKLSAHYNMFLLIGSVTKSDCLYYNSAILFSPFGEEVKPYNKRALWGWDINNFSEGAPGGIWTIDEYKIGVRICYEVRFPEYFRELYRAKADVMIVLFNDISETDDMERYELIKAHLRTRAVENVCTVMSVNSVSLYQTAPTVVIDNSGKVVAELSRDSEGLMVYDYQATETPYFALGRKKISDKLTGMS